MSFLASTVHPARRQGLGHAERVWDLADRRLAAGQGSDGWALGSYSIADIHLFRLYWRFAASLAVPPGRFPALDAHHDRMLARSAVARTIAIESAIGYELPA
jgi:glutathione S-transferase